VHHPQTKGSSHCHFHCAPGLATPVLAHMLNSLVRVTRRGKENHFVNLHPTTRGKQPASSQRPASALPDRPIEPDHATTQRPCRKRQGKNNVAHALVSFASFSVGVSYSLALFSSRLCGYMPCADAFSLAIALRVRLRGAPVSWIRFGLSIGLRFLGAPSPQLLLPFTETLLESPAYWSLS
jgi:hypothetical protein